MAELSSVISAIRKRSPEDEPADIVGAFAGFGSIFGIIAAAIGLLAGISLIPITSFCWEVITDDPFVWILGGSPQYSMLSGLFLGLLAFGLLLQAWGSKDLRSRLGGMFGSVFYVGFLAAALVALYITFGFSSVGFESYIASYLSTLYLVVIMFVIAWQMISVFYVSPVYITGPGAFGSRGLLPAHPVVSDCDIRQPDGLGPAMVWLRGTGGQ